MKRLRYSIDIPAPVQKVYDTMLGKETYPQWTFVFNPTSNFEGSWAEGEEIKFLGVDENGKKGGMLGIVAENKVNQYVRIEYTGTVQEGKELRGSEASPDWHGGIEAYTFSENNGITTVVAEVDVPESVIPYFDETYPKALEQLRDICK